MRNEPVTGEALLHGDGLSRTYLVAEGAAFAGNRVNFEIFDGVETAHLFAEATLGALLLVDHRNLPAPELVFIFDRWVQQQVEVGSVHIAVGQCLVFSNNSE